MINETKYRRQAMQSWEASREQTKQEIRTDVEKWLFRMRRMKKYLTQVFSLMFHRERHQ